MYWKPLDLITLKTWWVAALFVLGSFFATFGNIVFHIGWEFNCNCHRVSVVTHVPNLVIMVECEIFLEMPWYFHLTNEFFLLHVCFLKVTITLTNCTLRFLKNFHKLLIHTTMQLTGLSRNSVKQVLWRHWIKLNTVN